MPTNEQSEPTGRDEIKGPDNDLIERLVANSDRAIAAKLSTLPEEDRQLVLYALSNIQGDAENTRVSRDGRPESSPLDMAVEKVKLVNLLTERDVLAALKTNTMVTGIKIKDFLVDGIPHNLTPERAEPNGHGLNGVREPAPGVAVPPR